VQAIYEHIDTDLDENVSPAEFLKALKGPVKDTLKKMQRENVLKKEFEEKFGLNFQVPRELMLERLGWSVRRDDAFRSLPFSLVYICIFSFIVISHLMIWERQQHERGLEAWLEGSGQQLLGPYLESVANTQAMFDWLEVSGLPAVLDDCKVRAEHPDPRCLVGNRNILVGDAALVQAMKDGSQETTWLLHSQQAKDHLSLNPGDYLGAARAAILHLKTSRQADEQMMSICLHFATYGERSGLFAVTDAYIKINDNGYVLPATSSTSVIVQPYPISMVSKIVLFVFDGIYAMFSLVPMYYETKDMIHMMRLSGFHDGLRAYWGVWNIVDWVNISSFFISCVIWLFCCLSMWEDTIQSVLREDGDKSVLAHGIMDLSVEKLEKLDKEFAGIISLFNSLRIIMGLTACSILLKFFKAFQANPRLQLVTNTMVKAATDIVHFSIVLFAVFIGFALTGHILFGNDLVQFRNFASAMDTCFIVLMGEFAWYAEASESNLESMGSGMPRGMLTFWFWLYMVFVLMILLNMLLAIILDHYTELVTQIKLDLEVPALWEQSYHYLQNMRHTKDHIPLAHLKVLLEDDDTPCHTQNAVTEHTLLQAFPEMSRHQADHLMKWLRNESRKARHEGDDEVVARIKVLEQYIDGIVADMHIIKLNGALCSSRLRHQGGMGGPGMRASLGGAGGLGSGLGDQLNEQIDRLILKVGGACREISGRMQAASKEIENQSMTIQQVVSGPSKEDSMPMMAGSSLRPFQACLAPESCTMMPDSVKHSVPVTPRELLQ